MRLIKKEKLGVILIFMAAIFAFFGMLNLDPIAQAASYHNFVDSREVFNVSNFWNVASNICFLFVGSFGLYRLLITGDLVIIEEIKLAYSLLFSGVLLVSFGSAYYHLRPDNMTLVWDRLPMTVVFMALFSIIVGEFVSFRASKILLMPLVLAGIASVLYWNYTEIRGYGDLRFYIVIQFFPVLVIPFILIWFRARFTNVGAYWWLMLAYLAAKLFEYYDGQIFNILGYISGHSIKHIVAASGLYMLLISYESRIVINTEQ
jgi:hypothetical protein